MPLELIPVLAAGVVGGLAMLAAQVAASTARPGEVVDVVVGAVIHLVAAGAFAAVVSELGTAPARRPGAFGRALGPAGAVGSLGAHLVFGVVVGIVYSALHSSGGWGVAL